MSRLLPSLIVLSCVKFPIFLGESELITSKIKSSEFSEFRDSIRYSLAILLFHRYSSVVLHQSSAVLTLLVFAYLSDGLSIVYSCMVHSMMV